MANLSILGFLNSIGFVLFRFAIQLRFTTPLQLQKIIYLQLHHICCFVFEVEIQVLPEICNGSVLHVTWTRLNVEEITGETQEFGV